MEESPEGGSVDASPVIGNEILGSVGKGARARHVGGRRMSSRSKASKGMSPRLSLVEMKRGRKRGSANYKGIGASGSRRSGNRSNSQASIAVSSLIASPGSISVDNHFNSELDESNAGSGFRSAMPEDVEACGDISLDELISVEISSGLQEENVRERQGDVSIECRGEVDNGGMSLEEGGCSGEVDVRGVTEVALETRIEKGKEQLMVLNEGGTVMTEMDIALDQCEAQPLQNMKFLKSATSGLEVRSVEEGTKHLESREIYYQEKDMEEAADIDFPPLSKEGLKKGKNKVVYQSDLKQGKGGKVEIGPGGGIGRKSSKSHHVPLYSSERQKEEAGVRRQSIADIIKAGEKDPVSFEPDKIKRIGVAGESSGLPSIYFSGV